MPVRLGDGTKLAPQGFQEVRLGDGSVIWVAEQIIDSMEDGEIAEYGGDSASFSVQTGTVYDGTYGLKADSAGGGNVVISSTAGLDPSAPYTQQGDTFQCHTRTAAEGPIWGLLFGTQSETGVAGISGYEAFLDDSGNENHAIRRWDNGTETILTESAITETASETEWHRVHVDWASDGTITFTYYDSADTQMFQLAATDTTYTSGGVGYRHNGATGEEAYFDHLKYV